MSQLYLVYLLSIFSSLEKRSERAVLLFPGVGGAVGVGSGGGGGLRKCFASYFQTL